MLPRQFASAVFAATLALSLSACSKGGQATTSPVDTDPSPVSNASHYGDIYFDSALTPKERGAFVTAADYGAQMGLANANPELLRLMGTDGSGASVQSWLEERVRYIISDGTDGSKLAKTELGGFRYPFPGQYGSLDGPTASHEEVAHTIMANIGAVLYDMAKQGGFLWEFSEDGLGNVPLTSPRSGLLAVGEGLFMVPAQYPNAVKIFHEATLLHEARHSDGHALTAGFFHALCTSDDPDMALYKGKAACDHSTNGPYTVGALATEALARSCAACSETEKQLLYGFYLDFKSRVIFDNATSAWDDAPEGHR